MWAAWALSALALALGAGLGMRAMVDPRWAAQLVRLKGDEQGGGLAEFRGTYGGLFLGLHAAALLLTLKWLADGEAAVGAIAAGAAAAAAAGWAGAAFGRLFSILNDPGANTQFNRRAAGVAAVMALCVGGPWVAWIAGAGS